jgi:hypothetical protein
VFPEWTTDPGKAHGPAQEGIPEYSLLQMITGFYGFGVTYDKTSNAEGNFADLKK